MAMDPLTRKALEVGRQEAEKVLKRRSAALRRRAAAVRKPRVARRARRAPAVDERLQRAVGGPATAGVLVAEGDSWFDYPFNDILSLLEDNTATTSSRSRTRGTASRRWRTEAASWTS